MLNQPENEPRRELQSYSFKISNLLYYFGLILLFSSSFFQTSLLPSTFNIVALLIVAIKYSGITLLVLSFLIRRDIPMQFIAMFVLSFSISVIVSLMSGSPEIAFFTMVFFASYNMDGIKILKITFFCGMIVILAVFVLQNQGYLIDLIYYRGAVERHSFGFTYPTDLAAHFSYLVILYVGFRRQNFSYLELVGVCVVAWYVMTYFDARLDGAIILLTGISAQVLAHKRLQSSKLVSSSISKLAMLIMPLLAFLSTIMTLLWRCYPDKLGTLNTLLSNRLAMSSEGFSRYNVPLFGQRVSMSGFGGLDGYTLNREVYGYFMIDISYIRVLLMLGVLGVGLVTFYFVLTCKQFKHRQNNYYALCFILVAIHSFVAQFLLSISYDMIFAVGLSVFSTISYQVRMADESTEDKF